VKESDPVSPVIHTSQFQSAKVIFLMKSHSEAYPDCRHNPDHNFQSLPSPVIHLFTFAKNFTNINRYEKNIPFCTATRSPDHGPV
jgi:hypothetical protein